MKSEIIKLLREKNEYVSGQEICERFGVSRTAVWKAIENLRKDGYTIEASRNKGYRLINKDADVYNRASIEAAMKTNVLGHPCIFYEEIGSTNTEGKKIWGDNPKHGTLVIAKRQTAGRGRRGRVWEGNDAKNIYFSLLLKPEFLPDKAPELTIIIAIAVAAAIKESFPEISDEVGIKWPNDILIRGKKVCGVLTELSGERGYIECIVMGVGINVGVQKFSSEFADRATSIEAELGRPVSRADLIGKIISHFEKHYDRFVEIVSLAELKGEYEELLVNKGCEVRVLDPHGEYDGKALGIDETGRLLVEKSDGSIEDVYAGEVSVRGISGYF